MPIETNMPVDTNEPETSAGPDLKEKLILRELDDNIAWMRTLFQNFLTWYTFFITANLFVLSWIFTDKVQREGQLPLVVLFFVLNVCGVVTITLLRTYVTNAERRNIELVRRLNELAKFSEQSAMRPTFPLQLARTGFVFMAVGLIVIAALWVVVAFWHKRVLAL